MAAPAPRTAEEAPWYKYRKEASRRGREAALAVTDPVRRPLRRTFFDAYDTYMNEVEEPEWSSRHGTTAFTMHRRTDAQVDWLAQALGDPDYSHKSAYRDMFYYGAYFKGGEYYVLTQLPLDVIRQMVAYNRTDRTRILEVIGDWLAARNIFLQSDMQQHLYVDRHLPREIADLIGQFATPMISVVNRVSARTTRDLTLLAAQSAHMSTDEVRRSMKRILDELDDERDAKRLKS